MCILPFCDIELSRVRPAPHGADPRSGARPKAGATRAHPDRARAVTAVPTRRVRAVRGRVSRRADGRVARGDCRLLFLLGLHHIYKLIQPRRVTAARINRSAPSTKDNPPYPPTAALARHAMLLLSNWYTGSALWFCTMSGTWLGLGGRRLYVRVTYVDACAPPGFCILHLVRAGIS